MLKRFIVKWLKVYDAIGELEQMIQSRKDENTRLKNEVNALTERVSELERESAYNRAVARYLGVEFKRELEVDPRWATPEPRMMEVVRAYKPKR